MGLPRTFFEMDGNFSRKWQIFSTHPRLFCNPADVVPIGIGYRRKGLKTRMIQVYRYRPRSKLTFLPAHCHVSLSDDSLLCHWHDPKHGYAGSWSFDPCHAHSSATEWATQNNGTVCYLISELDKLITELESQLI